MVALTKRPKNDFNCTTYQKRVMFEAESLLKKNITLSMLAVLKKRPEHLNFHEMPRLRGLRVNRCTLTNAPRDRFSWT